MPPTIYNNLLASAITPADVAGMVTMTSPAGTIYDPTALAATPQRRIVAPALWAAHVAARIGQTVAFDAEHDESAGQYIDPRYCNNRRRRHTARRVTAGLEESRRADPSSIQTIYGFNSRDWYAAIEGGSRLAAWQAAQRAQADLYAPICDQACMDLYLFSFLTSYTLGQLNSYIDTQLDILRENGARCAGPNATTRQLVFVWPQYHNADATPYAPVNPTLWQRLNERLAARGDVDPVAWGMFGEDWVTWKATAPTLWPIFRTAWGI